MKSNVFDGFQRIKKKGMHDDFHQNSKKIFYKIGFAVVLLMAQKEKERSLVFALRRMKKFVKSSKREEKRIEILRKKFHKF